MTVKVGINGLGRIGRNLLRVVEGREEIEVVAVNDLADTGTLAYLCQYDSVHGRFPGTVLPVPEGLEVNGRLVGATQHADPSHIKWGDSGVEIVVESTGRFRSKEDLDKHLNAGARKVILSAPGRGVDATVVMGVNHLILEPGHRRISNASCTTNCLAPVASVLNDRFGLIHGLITTVHAYTNDQRILDSMHPDRRRARAAATNIIPTSTGAASAVGQVIPELKGKLDGMAMRVPVDDGSVIDLVCRLEQHPTVDLLNAALREAAAGDLAGIMSYTEDPIVSSDIKGDPHSCIIDGAATMSIDSGMVKLICWYDNEWGFTNRLADLIAYLDKLG